MNFDYKLSICMMVKNEEKNIKRCLDSLVPLIKDDRVELIIVDTGSTDDTADIAREYTSKVYFHQWNNHFSEMRNITISYARGEWLFIIDADEVLIDVDKMLELLFSEKLEGYNTVEFKVRNFTDLHNKDKFGVSQLVRMFRNDEDFRYEGAVHNQPKIKLPILNTNIYLDHFGYISNDKDLMEKKFRRTSAILKDELKKNPKNIYYQFQLAVSYSMYKDEKNALIEIEKAFDLINKKPLKERCLYTYMYGTYARIAFNNRKLKETIKICKKGIELRADYIDLYFTLALALQMIGDKKEAVEVYKKFVKLANSYNELSISKDPAYTMYNLDNESKSYAVLSIIEYYCDNSQYKDAYRYIDLIEDDDRKSLLLIKVLINLEKYRELKEYYDTIATDINRVDFFTTQLELYKVNVSAECSKKTEQAFSEGEDSYAIFNKIKSSKGSLRKKLVKDFLNSTDFNYIPLFYGDILLESLPDIKVFVSTAKNIQTSKLKQYIRYILEKDNTVISFFIEYLSTTETRDDDFQSNRVYKAIANMVIRHAVEQNNLDEVYISVFKGYLNKGMKYINYLYHKEKLRLVYKTLENEEEKFLISMHFCEDAINRKNVTVAAKYLKDAIEAYPCMGEIIKEYKKEIFDNVK